MYESIHYTIFKMKHIEKHRYMLEVLKNAKPKLRKAILQQCDDDLVCVLAEIIVNLMDGQINITSQQKQKLKPYKVLFRKIRKHCNHRPSQKILRRKVIQTGGALPFLIPLLMPLIAKAALAGAVSTGVGVAAKKIIG